MKGYDTFFIGCAGGLLNAVTDYIVCENSNKTALFLRRKISFCNNVTPVGFFRGCLGGVALTAGYTCACSAYNSLTNPQLSLAKKVMKVAAFTIASATLGYGAYLSFS